MVLNYYTAKIHLAEICSSSYTYTYVALTASQLQSVKMSRTLHHSQMSGFCVWPTCYVVKQTGTVPTSGIIAVIICCCCRQKTSTPSASLRICK